jgi:hypothetical protein
VLSSRLRFARVVKANIKMVVGTVAATVIVLSAGLSAWLRILESRQLSQLCPVQTYGGTNYVVQLQKTVVGRTDNGYVVILYARLQNPNAYDVQLQRDWFVLIDGDKEYFLPTTNGTQTATITLPAGGVRDGEMFSFALPETALGGTIALKVGKDYWVMVKEDKPFDRILRNGEFVSFRRRQW